MKVKWRDDQKKKILSFLKIYYKYFRFFLCRINNLIWIMYCKFTIELSLIFKSKSIMKYLSAVCTLSFVEFEGYSGSWLGDLWSGLGNILLSKHSTCLRVDSFRIGFQCSVLASPRWLMRLSKNSIMSKLSVTWSVAQKGECFDMFSINVTAPWV